MFGYRPAGMAMWDTWYLEHAGQAHMIHLQRLAPESQRTPEEGDSLGHASSDDLIHWTEHQLALAPGPQGALDDMQPWTGCVLEHAGTFYLYYTMRASADKAAGQRIGLALSDDLDHWVRYADNPVIVPDPRWYVSHERPLPRGVVDCRDLVIVPDPNGTGWLGFYAARVPAGEEAETAVIAVARSSDLINWEHLAPAFAPRKYACIEVPDVFFLDGRWYMTCLTGTGYGNRGIFSDPYAYRGTIYAVAERPEGPYHELDGDNTLVGGDFTCGYSCRSLLFEGERYVFYTQPTPDRFDTLSPPMLVGTTSNGRLRLRYSPRTEVWRSHTLLSLGDLPAITHLPYSQGVWPLLAGRWELSGRAYHGESRTGWQIADLGIGAENCEIEARVTLHDGVAVGVVFRPNTSMQWPDGDVVFALDVEEQCVFVARVPDFGDQRRWRYPVRHGQTYHLRVCLRWPRVEVFLDDELVLQCAMSPADWPAPSVGLFVDRGHARVDDLAVYALGA